MSEQATIGSLSELAKMPGAYSEPVLVKLIKENPDFPVIEHGAKGRSYKIDIPAALDWLQAHRGKKIEAERTRTAQVQRFSADLLGQDAATDVSQAGLSSTERRELYEEEMTAIKLGAARGEFVRKSSVEDGIASILTQLNGTFRGLSARLAKRTDLTRRQRALIDEMLGQELHKLADRLEKLGRDGALSDDHPAV